MTPDHRTVYNGQTLRASQPGADLQAASVAEVHEGQTGGGENRERGRLWEGTHGAIIPDRTAWPFVGSLPVTRTADPA
jgi:hypothetical protein